MIRDFTGKRVCCIGDGGNDVSMIQAADVGIGIVGKEGKQASLAADFSITPVFLSNNYYCMAQIETHLDHQNYLSLSSTEGQFQFAKRIH